MSVAGEAPPEPHLYFCQRQKCKRVRSGSYFANGKNADESVRGRPGIQISVYRAVGKADNAKCRMQNAE